MFSAGVAEWTGDEDMAEFIKRADMATYEAKHLDRNRTVVADAVADGEENRTPPRLERGDARPETS